jgi:hypothetical protein
VSRDSSSVPRSTQHRGIGVLRVPLLAGWLFADLFLVLFIVAFSAQPSVTAVKPTPTPTPTINHSASPSHTTSFKPSPTPKPTPPGMESTPVNAVITVSPAAVDDPATRTAAVTKLLAGLNGWLRNHHLLGRSVGFVVIFATSVAGASDPLNEAIHVAQAIVLPDLEKQDSGAFGGAGGEGLWAGESGSFFHFQIFFYTK